MDINYQQLESRVKEPTPSSTGLVKSAGPDPLRIAKEELQEAKLKHTLELQIHVQSLLSYQQAPSQAMGVGYDLKLDLVKEALDAAVVAAAAEGRRRTSTSSTSHSGRRRRAALRISRRGIGTLFPETNRVQSERAAQITGKPLCVVRWKSFLDRVPQCRPC